MAIRSYDSRYVEAVADNLGAMFEYAANCGYEPQVFWDTFTSSTVAKRIEEGNPHYLVGLSAKDLLLKVTEESGNRADISALYPFFDRSEYYWAGWALAQYQWKTSLSFYDLNKAFPIQKVLSLYPTLHEADITRFYETANAYVNAQSKETNLKRIRRASGLSQSQLAKKADVSLRSIQMYEQCRNNVNKAQADVLLRLAKTLGCKLEDLLEPTHNYRA